MIQPLARTETPDLSTMVYFSGGEFLMGDDEGAIPERPRHSRTVGPFWLDKYLVTNSCFAAFIKATGYRTTC